MLDYGALRWWPLLKVPLVPGGPWYLGKSALKDPTSAHLGYRNIGLERINIPYGTFERCAVPHHPIGAIASEWRWFCPGIGFVRQEGYGNNPGNYPAKLELVEFVRGSDGTP